MTSKITLKQRGFVRSYISNGGNGTQAALESYNTNDPNTAHSIASENLQKPAIKRAIEQALERAGLTDEYISKLLRKAVTSGLGVKATNADALRGIDMMLKLKGAYPSPTQKSTHLHIGIMEQVKDMNYSEVTKKLEEIDLSINEIMKSADTRTTP